MVSKQLVSAEQWFLGLANSITNGRYWLIKVTVIATLVTLFFTFPSYDTLLNGGLQGSTWDAVMAKSSDLGYDVLKIGQFGLGANAAKVNFRLTVPVIAHLFQLSKASIFLLQSVFGIILLALCAWLTNDITKSRLTALLVTLLIGGLQAGITSFVETRGLFDGVALTILILALIARNPFLIGGLFFVGAWSDERVIFASTLVILFHTFRQKRVHLDESARDNTNDVPRVVLSDFLNPATLGVLVALGLYAVTRLLYGETFHITQSLVGVGLHVLIAEINQIPLGLLWAFKGGWLLIIFTTICLLNHREYLFLLFCALALAVIFTVAFFTEDISRSTSYAMPALFVILLVLTRFEEKQAVETYILMASAITLLLPDYYIGSKSVIWDYPLPMQIIRWLLLSRGVKSS